LIRCCVSRQESLDSTALAFVRLASIRHMPQSYAILLDLSDSFSDIGSMSDGHFA
jgi:hypothetical protein